MKTCPHCTSGYPDALDRCPTHGMLLNEIRDLKPGLVIRSTYRIVCKLGQGGMGSVYLADHLLMGEPRALKFIAADLAADEAFTSRFLLEVKSLHRLRHPNVIDCGDLERAEDDSLFFAMEYADGPTLRHLISQMQQPMDAGLALELVRGVAAGLGAAHRLGMVHRDIKPENILMARHQGHWVPKIADFGLVATQEYAAARTHTGAAAMTMPYAAPEQWLGAKAVELDGRTDLYALGGLLYELLTGRTAFEAENYQGWFAQHVTTVPLPPSRYRPELARWKGLDAAVLRLLEKNREQRPRDVAETLALLEAITPDVAAPEPVAQELPQPVAAQPLPVPAGLEAAPMATPPLSIRPEAPRPMPAPVKPEAAPVAAPVISIAAPLEAEPVIVDPAEGTVSMRRMRGRHLVEVLVLLLLAVVGYFGWRHSRPQARTLTGHEGVVVSVVFSPDGQRLATASDDKSIRLWDVATAQPLRILTTQAPGLHAVAFSPDGHTLASASDDKAISLWDAATGQRLRSMLGHEGSVIAVAFSPDGRTLASAGSDNVIRLWDAVSGLPLHTMADHSNGTRALAYSPDSQTLASAGNDHTVKLWDVTSGEHVRTFNGHDGPVTAVAYSSDGRKLASGSWDKTIKLWDTSTGEQLRSFTGSGAQVLAVAFSSDGWLLASGNEDNSIQLWNPVSGDLLRSLTGHTDHVGSLAFSPDGHLLASGSWDRTVRIWDLSRLR